MTMGDATILSVVTRLNVGGPAAILTALLDHAPSDGPDHLLAAGRTDQGEADWLALRAPHLEGDPRILPVPNLVRPIDPRRDLAAYRELRGLIRSHRPDLVHTHTAKAGAVGRLAALHEGVPHLVHSFHGHTLHGYFGRSQTAVLRQVERRLARRTDLLLAVGARVRDELLTAGIGRADRFEVVPPAVPAPRTVAREAAREQFGLAPDVPVIAFVGRLAGVKRPDRLLSVAEQVTARHPEAVLVVAGGATPAELAELQVAERDADVRLLGWVEDVGAVYAASDVVLLTSDNEGMPVTLIEAGLCGRPCVATDVGSVGEVVLDGRTGRVVPPRIDALTDAVIDLLEDRRARERLGAAARGHTQRTFGLEASQQRLASLYDHLLER
jgi:glycosyltransferase involved in cell wall biosynthesis